MTSIFKCHNLKKKTQDARLRAKNEITSLINGMNILFATNMGQFPTSSGS